MFRRNYIRFLLVLMLIWMTLATTELADTNRITHSQLKIKQDQFQEELEKIFMMVSDDENIYLRQANIQAYMQRLKSILQKYQKMKDDMNDDFDLEILTAILTPLPLKVDKITNIILFNHKIDNFDISSNIGNIMMIKRIKNTAENKISIRNGIVISFIINLYYPSLFARYYGYVENKNYLYVISEYFLTNITTFNNTLFTNTSEKISDDNRLSFLMKTTKDIRQNTLYFLDAKRNYLYSDFKKVNEALKQLHVEHTNTVVEFSTYEKNIWFQIPKFENFKISTLEDFQFIMKPDFKNSTLVSLNSLSKPETYDYYDNREERIHKMININNSRSKNNIQINYQEEQPNFKLVQMLPEKETPSNSIHKSLFENYLNNLNETSSNFNTEFYWKKEVSNKKEAKKYDDDEILFELNYFQTLEVSNIKNLNDLASKSVKKNQTKDKIQSKSKLNDPVENIWSNIVTDNFKKSGLNYFRKYYQNIWDMILQYTGIQETITKLSVINSKFFTDIDMIRRKYFEEKTTLSKPMRISEKSLRHLANYKLLKKFDKTDHVFSIYSNSSNISEHTLTYFPMHSYYLPPFALQLCNPYQLIKLFIGKSEPTEFWYNCCTKRVIIYNYDTMKIVGCYYAPLQFTKCFRFVLVEEKTTCFEIKFYIDEIVNISITEHIFTIHFENSEGTTANYCICKKDTDSFTKGVAKISERYLFCNNFDLFKVLDL